MVLQWVRRRKELIIIIGQAFPSFLKRAGFFAFYFFMGINFILAIIVYFFVPETKGVSLEHMDALFGGIDHVAAGEKVDHDATFEGQSQLRGSQKV